MPPHPLHPPRRPRRRGSREPRALARPRTSSEVKAQLGRHLAAMLTQFGDRGPDSSGVAVTAPGFQRVVQLTLFSADPEEDWAALGERTSGDVRGLASARGSREPRRRGRRGGCRGCGGMARDCSPAASSHECRQGDRDLQGGGPSRGVRRGFASSRFRGTHALGHTRMATESRVTTEGSHPFSTGHDLCLVHNGSLSNHNRLREELRREGIEFQTENDTEVAAGVSDVAAARGRVARAGAGGLPRGSRRLLHLPRRDGRRLCGAAGPDRLQAGGARGDGGLGGDGVRVPGDRGAAGGGRGADLGARTRRSSTHGSRAPV